MSDDEDFAAMFAASEQAKPRGAKRPKVGDLVKGTIVTLGKDSVFVDLGGKAEGQLDRAQVTDPEGKLLVKVGDVVEARVVSDAGGVLSLRTKLGRGPEERAELAQAHDLGIPVEGLVTEVVKGGLSVDVAGVRGFCPASQIDTRFVEDLNVYIGQRLTFRITRYEPRNLVLSRRALLEEENERRATETRKSLVPGLVVRGKVVGFKPFGAFVDIGGIDGLLHVSDMAYTRNVKPSDVVAIGDVIDVKILKIGKETKKISLGLKQLLPDPWSLVPEKYPVGSRVKGKVARVADFGAFVELEAGIEGLIHVSEMSWTRKNVRAQDIVKEGDQVEVVILGVNPADKRIALGLKQALGDPWEEAVKKYPAGGVAEGKVTSLTKFGAFVDLGDNIEGMVHIGDISREKRLNHPNEVLKVGQTVKAQVLEADKERRRIRLGIKQLEPTSIDEYIAEHKAGDSVSGRLVEVSGQKAKVELGEGVFAWTKLAGEQPAKAAATAAKADLGSLTAMLSQRWKSGGAGDAAVAEAPKAGQVRSFKILSIDAAAKRIELELL
jgi:small subunit ribosomal protein S1